MSSNKISDLSVSFIKRNARKRGPNASSTWNDSVAELAQDLAGLYDQWNNRFVPLTSLLPDGSIDTDVDAYANGLDGRTMYVNSESTNSISSLYYHDSLSRPNTISEQFDDVYSTITDLKEDLQGEITAVAVAASDIGITDSDALYTASNVEDALDEVMTAVNSFMDGSAYLPLAGGSMLGNLNMNNQQIIMSPSVIIRTGTGSPEGAVVANIGSIYLRLDGSTSTTLYMKTAGNGLATGWSAK